MQKLDGEGRVTLMLCAVGIKHGGLPPGLQRKRCRGAKRQYPGMSGTVCPLSSRNDDRLCRRQKVNSR